ncbi:MAG: PilZ domain-containing protein [Acidobacteria bacterium]|nr:PilZ domain-containing protein [Acidobacteriota bacterium]MCI0623511.1 PilZ domain-containing protein [Acidobacteriota bacterium]MCI0720848.1 PilZ domain-containing protein [Acidobacteriota bacterium]
MKPPDTRKYPRVELINDAYFELGRQEVAAQWTDICSIGVFVQTHNPLPAGEQVKLRLRLTPDGKLYRAVGVVRHSLKWVGMGVEFTHLHPTAKSSIEHLAALRI